jgi:SWI/SNF-related matrix-associated actin-dependent regulator of chromatin subfamily A3
MQRYMEMGFSETLSLEAADRFGDDLYGGCHWLMTQEQIGRVPKRLCRHRVATETYRGSEIHFDGLTWKVNDFDKKHAIVRMTNGATVSRWIHIADARLEWRTVNHRQVAHSVPRPSWVRKMGTVQLSKCHIAPMENTDSATTDENFVQRLTMTIHSPSNPIVAAIRAFTRRLRHLPERPPPLGTTARDVHRFRVELMTYFMALCDIYHIEERTFALMMYEKTEKEILILFPPSEHVRIRSKIRMWKFPQRHLREQRMAWEKDCLSLVLFHIEQIDDESLHIGVQFHDMTFVQIERESGLKEKYFQTLFSAMFNRHEELHSPLTIDDHFLRRTLRLSSKDWGPTEPSNVFVSTLLPFQKETLAWLKWRETEAPAPSTWGWYRHQLEDGFAFHTSEFGHISHTPPPNTVRGGILAQDVGMGKTVEMLALIASVPMPGPTLVIMPTTMLPIWMMEAKRHVPSLKTVKFHGARRQMKDVRTADIVCTTYRIVANESQKQVPTLGSMSWGRIILDESHAMKGLNSVAARAVCHLSASSKWCVSATPWAAQGENISVALAFLNVMQCQSNAELSSLHASTCQRNARIIQKLFISMTWWQKKKGALLNVPGMTSETMASSENVHCIAYRYLIIAIKARMEMDNKTQTKSSARCRQLHYKRLLSIAAVHPSLLPMSAFGLPSTNSDYQTEHDTIESFVSTLGDDTWDCSLKETIDSWRIGHETCAICRDAIERATLTPCHHLFCYECIQSAYQFDSERKCPLCRTPAGTQCLKELTVSEPDATEGEKWNAIDENGRRIEMSMKTYRQIVDDLEKPSSKIEQLKLIANGMSGKVVVFTRYHTVCTYLCEEMKRCQIKHVSIQGHMSPKCRENSINAFQHDDDIKVFVMTLKTAAVGITLTAASTIVFMEPCPDYSIRKQAIGRLWRIGQTQAVRVVVLQSPGTIDTVAMETLMGRCEEDENVQSVNV